MRHATGPLAATSPRPFMLKAAVAALAGIGLLSTASVWAQEAVAARDTPLLMGVILVSAMAVIVVNLLVDIAYAVLDPRVGAS